MKRCCLFIIIAALTALAPNILASNCSNTSVGKAPLNDLGKGYYMGYQGGLYPGGSNIPPPAHFSAGLHEAMQVKKLDLNGNPGPTGKIVLISVGMSNTTQEFSAFKPLANADPRKNPDLVIVDGAQGGQDATVWANPDAAVWDVVDSRLAAAGVGPNQVQVVWLKQAVRNPNKPFPNDAQELKGYLKLIVQNIKMKYPNTRLLYLSSRIYAGYATTTLNAEPYAYQSGFSVKWLIENQIDGAEDLNFDPYKGPVKAPWIAWGPYLWADGLTPRSDGLIWECVDFQESDGTHPSTSGRQKVANMLLEFFKSDSTTVPWFTRDAYKYTNPAQAKMSSDGTAVALSWKAVIMGTGVLANSIYIEEPDRSSGIRVSGGTATEEEMVNVTGVVQTAPDGERFIDASSVVPSPIDIPAILIQPVGLTNKSLGGGDFGSSQFIGQRGVAGGIGLNNIGLLVTTWGRVSMPGPLAGFSVFDGSLVDVRITVPDGVTPPPPGAYVKVTGISSCYPDQYGGLHRLIRVRKQGDIVVVK